MFTKNYQQRFSSKSNKIWCIFIKPFHHTIKANIWNIINKILSIFYTNFNGSLTLLGQSLFYIVNILWLQGVTKLSPRMEYAWCKLRNRNMTGWQNRLYHSVHDVNQSCDGPNHMSEAHIIVLLCPWLWFYESSTFFIEYNTWYMDLPKLIEDNEHCQIHGHHGIIRKYLESLESTLELTHYNVQLWGLWEQENPANCFFFFFCFIFCFYSQPYAQPS